jgi:hypothetical protein
MWVTVGHNIDVTDEHAPTSEEYKDKRNGYQLETGIQS